MSQHSKYIILLGLMTMIMLLPKFGVAQQVIVNAKGERIVVFPDGSWRYFEPTDSTLLENQLLRQTTSEEDFSNENFTDPTLQDEASRKRAAAFIIKLQGEENKTRNILIKATNEKFNAEAKMKQAQENSGLIEPDITEGLEMAYSNANEKVKTAKKLNAGLEKLLGKAINLPDMPIGKREKELAKLQAKYATLTNSPIEISPPIVKQKPVKKKKERTSVVDGESAEKPKRDNSDRKNREKKVKGSTKQGKIAGNEKGKKNNDRPTKVKKQKKNADGLANNQEKIKNPKKTRDGAKSNTGRRAERDQVVKQKDRSTNRIPKAKSVALKSEKRAHSKKYTSEPYSCVVAEDILDDVTLQRRVVMERVTIFSHTDDELRPYFRDSDLLKCRANLSSISAFKYLTMQFRISSSNARKNFGMLQEGSLLRIKLLDGSFLNFFNIQTDRGRIDNYTGDTVFTGYYSLGKSAEKALLKSEVDKVRVVWSTGYEDYDIYELNFFIDQINCLNKK